MADQEPCKECAARAASQDDELVALLRHAMLVAVLALALYAWQSGWLDKMMTPKAA